MVCAQIVSLQRAWYNTGATRNLSLRITFLRRLRERIILCRKNIQDALYEDLGKSPEESYMTEIGMALSEVSWMLEHLKGLARPSPVRTPLAQFPAVSWVEPSPLGVVLVMSPWNYPFLLSMAPLIDAIAAGNTVVLKPSSYAPRTAEVIRKLMEECFPAELVATVLGGRAANEAVLEEKFDHIFFTGSQPVGRIVMEKAARHLTPVTLELGGKSPCIVERTANIPLAARRIVFGKFLNAGQTCVAPDYILCDEAVREPLIEALREEIWRQYGFCPVTTPDYGRIVNTKHYFRLLGLLKGLRAEQYVVGGFASYEDQKIEPTVLDGVTWDDRIMQEEIFGPLLPILAYRDLDAALEEIERRPHPLAFYIFTENRALGRKVLRRCSFGGGCLNDVVIHLATSEMPFGGVGESGMGAYHGRAGFLNFSHLKSIVDKKTWLDLPIRYQPYTRAAAALTRAFLH